ncbi:MAG TPA: phosphate ABC transporter permease subunit PstC [Candidatus Poseidoniaceae archaeon]|nr:phosphate ABC transporter permease subunit PstC [Candidatus Poseidoniaceae archaeon]
MSETENKQGSDKPSLVEKLAKDPMRYILFLTSFSVILITLGIIQTLLFEAVTFFQDIADSRGWFGLEIEMDGVFSAQGTAGILLLGCLLLEIFMNRSLYIDTERIPQKFLFPGDLVVRLTFLLLPISYILYGELLLVIALLLAILTWRILASRSIGSTSREDGPADRTFATVLGVFAFISLFFALTTNYTGAFGEFFFQTQWTPTGACSDRRTLCDNMSFGVNSLLLTTLQVAFGALLIAVPLGVGCAIYLSEYASPRLVAVVKPTLEILAGIPSVVYGFFAFIYIGPLVVEFGEYAFAQGWISEPPNILNPINGAIVVAIMILPLIASMSEDALRAVPNELREGSLALGATRIETTFRVMLQASLSGIIASIILALSRAVGETMAVTLAVGTVAVYTSNMFLPAQTMTAYIAQRVGGDLPFGEIGYLTIFAVGLYLFVITLCLNLLGNKVLSTYREAY